MVQQGRQAPKQGSLCAICKEKESKYRCSACPIRYCSVPCYKAHKVAHPDDPAKTVPQRADSAAPLAPAGAELADPAAEGASYSDRESSPKPLRPLTSLSWPPEPDEAIFDDPLMKEDAKPLRHVELERIATSADLRQLLSTTPLSRILRAIDALPTPGARSAILSRCLSIDEQSLAKPTGPSDRSRDGLLSQRDSPPPLEDLLYALAGRPRDDANVVQQEQGFYIGQKREGVDRIWIGEEEKRIMRIWANVVCKAIDGGDGDAWGGGDLSWEA